MLLLQSNVLLKLVLPFFVWNQVKISMKKQDCDSKILGVIVASTDGF